ncbi:MAG: hypothetical protein Q9209_003658 [Squamulea sp. 1 TL-2023]
MESAFDRSKGAGRLADYATTPFKRRRSDSLQHNDDSIESTHLAKREHRGHISNEGQPISTSLSNRASHLHLPDPSDSAATLSTKLTAIVTRISSGQSIAAATGFLATPNPHRDPVAKATQEMHPYELEYWDAYITNPDLIEFPNIDWSTDIDTSPTSKKPIQNAKRRAEALNRLYQTDQAQPGHSVWFTKHHEYLLPLVKAMARVIGAERDICGGSKGLAKADLQTVNAILSTVGKMVSEEQHKIDGSLIALVNSVLGAERQRLRALVL